MVSPLRVNVGSSWFIMWVHRRCSNVPRRVGLVAVRDILVVDHPLGKLPQTQKSQNLNVGVIIWILLMDFTILDIF